MHDAVDEPTRLQILRSAIRALPREQERGDVHWHRRGSFVRLFTFHWRKLPTEEAKAVVHELVRGIMAEPDGPIRASSNDVQFSSTRENQLYGILGPLRRLDPELADSLIREHSQLAAAAARHPYGMGFGESDADARPAPPRPAVPVGAQEHVIAVGRRLIPISEALVRVSRKHSTVRFGRTNQTRTCDHPNDAPQECWPSAEQFRTILYNAGRYEGRGAVRHLERIPDPNLRLFAQIEFAAGLAGLPQIGGTTMKPGPDGFHRSRAMRARARESGRRRSCRRQKRSLHGR